MISDDMLHTKAQIESTVGYAFRILCGLLCAVPLVAHVVSMLYTLIHLYTDDDDVQSYRVSRRAWPVPNRPKQVSLLHLGSKLSVPYLL